MTASSTIDWDAHWEHADRTDLSEMQAAGERMAHRLERYFDSFPPSLAAVGCGPAFMLFELAPDHPETNLAGYDPAASVMQENESLAADREFHNLTFHRGSLPTFSAERTVACITCIATLHYVADIETAIARLLAHVEPGGVLIFNYPNRYTRRMYQNDPDTNTERFKLVLRGENLLTYEGIRCVTNRQPRSFWKAVGEDDWRTLGQKNPCVIIEK